jgi:hypothetical protein
MPKMTFADDPTPSRAKNKYPKGHPREPVIIRIRSRRALLNRINEIVAHDRQVYQESWTLSDALREVIYAWVDRREAEIEIARNAGFTGTPPVDVTDADDDDVGAEIKIAAN